MSAWGGGSMYQHGPSGAHGIICLQWPSGGMHGALAASFSTCALAQALHPCPFPPSLHRLEALRRLVPHDPRANTANFLEDVRSGRSLQGPVGLSHTCTLLAFPCLGSLPGLSRTPGPETAMQHACSTS